VACVALYAALRHLGRPRMAQLAWVVLGVVLLHLAVLAVEPWYGLTRPWLLADVGLVLSTWGGLTALLITVIGSPRQE
jgi:hypothetical protein